MKFNDSRLYIHVHVERRVFGRGWKHLRTGWGKSERYFYKSGETGHNGPRTRMLLTAGLCKWLLNPRSTVSSSAVRCVQFDHLIFPHPVLSVPHASQVFEYPNSISDSHLPTSYCQFFFNAYCQLYFTVYCLLLCYINIVKWNWNRLFKLININIIV